VSCFLSDAFCLLPADAAIDTPLRRFCFHIRRHVTHADTPLFLMFT